MTDRTMLSGNVLRTDRLLALAAAVIAGMVYIITLAPSVSFWDSGEYITCSWTAGIPHPPGVPLFVLLGRFSTVLFSMIPAVAARVNLLCALAGAATIGILTRLIQRWGMRMGFTPSWYRPMSILSGMIAAFSYSIWRNSNASETYATALLLTFIILWSFDCWLARYGERERTTEERDRGGWGEAKYLLLIAYLIILAIGNHGSVPFIAGPPILLLYLFWAMVRKRSTIWKRSWFILTMLGLVVLAFSVHLYMPLRAVQDPEINETDPSRWSSFEKALSREQYGHTSVLDRKGPLLDQMGLYLEYLSWQSGRVQDGWDRIVGEAAGPMASMVLKVVLIFGALYGLAALGMKKPKLLIFISLLFLMSSFLFIFFALNFKTGEEGTILGEVRERDYFFGASFAFFAMLSGIGLVSAMKDLTSAARGKAAWILLAVPAITLAVNYHRCDRSNSYFARDYGINLLETCPEGAVLITNGDNDTFPLWFAQGVLGVRRDVIVSNLSLMNTQWYIEQLLDRDPLLLNYRDLGIVDSLRPVFVWGPHQFHVSDRGAPASSEMDGRILRATFDQTWPWAILEGPTAIAMPVEGSADQGALSLQDLVLLEMVGRRPLHGRDIYFAGTVAHDSRIYLEHYQEMEGIAYRITRSPVVDAVNSARGWELMQSYQFTGVDDPSVYKCDQAVQLLRNYVSGYHQLAYHYLSLGEADSAAMALEGARTLFTTLPGEWLRILPSRSIVEARLIDGVYGAAAARDTLLSLADIVIQAGNRLGSPDLVGSGNYLAGMATGTSRILGYQQELEYEELFTAMDDGSLAFDWLRVELALLFTDFIQAWSIVDSMEVGTDPLSNHMIILADETLTGIAETSSVTARLNMLDTGLAMVFELIDTSDPESFSLLPGTGAADMISRMYELASRGRTMSAVSAGLVLAAKLPDEGEAGMVRLCAEELLRGGADSRRNAEWFVIERNRVSPEALAFMSAEMGSPPMVFTALSGSGSVQDNVLQRILDDPERYVDLMPPAGSGSGDYAWVRALGGGG